MINESEKILVLSRLRQAVSEDPEMFDRAMVACRVGLTARDEENVARAMDFETATVCLLNARKGGKNQKGHLALAQDMIMRHEGSTRNNWPAYAVHLPLVK